MQTKPWKRIAKFNQCQFHRADYYFAYIMETLCANHSSFSESGTISALVKSRDYNGLIELADSLVSQKYETASEHFEANQFALLIKKYPFAKGSVRYDPEREGIRKFLKSEHKCKRSNQRFLCYRGRSPFEAYLSEMRGFIRYVIGDEPNLSEVLGTCDFGPGASIGVHGNATHAGKKLLSAWSVTPSAYEYGKLAVSTHEQIREYLLLHPSSVRYVDDSVALNRAYAIKTDVVVHNNVTFVPKTAKTHRAIAIEPLMNGYLQKGVDNFFRKRLKRVGVRLDDQSWNQELARLGSLDDSSSSPVTIDLAAASDSLAVEVVRDLLPPAWFDLLNALRSKSGLIDGQIIDYQKFCSMGNGFCFPLESLIFAAATKVAGGSLGVNSAVYGDDIIIPKEKAELLVKLLGILGFDTNTEKTFLSGPFRESCGSDWFGGKDVRPFTLDFRLDSIQSIFKLLNLVQRNSFTRSFFGALTMHTFKVPQFLRLVRPYPGNADTAVTVSLDEFMSSPFAKWSQDLYAWSWRELAYSPVNDREFSKRSAYYYYALVYGALRGTSSQCPFPLRRMTHTKFRTVTGSGATSQWLPAPARS